MDKKVFIIAEAGVNHNGSLELAKKLVDAAKRSGADAVKFQTFSAEELATQEAPRAEYQVKNVSRRESQLEMLKRLELGKKEQRSLMDYCARKGIMFLSSPFDLGSIDFLAKSGLKIFKIPSGEITNLPYLKKIGMLRKKIIISTGMANMSEIKQALAVLTKAGTRKSDITVLHCNTAYPTCPKDVNLLAMPAIRNALGVRVGYSDHTLGIEVPIAAAALGASVIEKHFTLSRKMKGPDHIASLEPQELKEMVMAVRTVEKALGNGVKKPSPSEIKNRIAARKSLVASHFIKKGEIFSWSNVAVKRPGSGIDPMDQARVFGKPAKRDFKQDEMIKI